MDTFKTPFGEVKVEIIGHASIHIEWQGIDIFSDPYSEAGDFSKMNPADLILITHSHYDHFDEKAFSKIVRKNTIFVVNKEFEDADYEVLENGESYRFNEDILIESVPAYNIDHRNNDGNLFHPKGVGNGYIVNIQGWRMYIAGDTEPIEEMKNLGHIDVAFLPKNLPYTMSDEEFVKAANMVMPDYLYPIHYFELDMNKLRGELKSIKLCDPTASNENY